MGSGAWGNSPSANSRCLQIPHPAGSASFTQEEVRALEVKCMNLG